MVVNQQRGKEVLSSAMVPGKWYRVQELITLFAESYDRFEQEDLDPIKSEPGRPRWHRRITNCVRMSPGRDDYATDNSWHELRTRKVSTRSFEYSLSIPDPVEAEIVNSRDDDGTGFVYAITNESFGGNWVKIGMTIDLEQRLSAYQVYSPYQNYQVIGSVSVFDRRTAECRAHRLASDRTETAPSGEWFNIGEDDALEVLQIVHRRFCY
jgi:hypothetical protein